MKIRASLHRDVINICKETCHFLGLEITKPAMDIVAELLFNRISLYAADLEAFAKHAKRATVNCEDVKLLVRRNPSLKALLNKLAPSTTKEKSRKSSLPVTKQSEASTSKTKQEKEKTENAKKEKEQIQKELKEAEERELERILEQQAQDMSVDVIDLTI